MLERSDKMQLILGHTITISKSLYHEVLEILGDITDVYPEASKVHRVIEALELSDDEECEDYMQQHKYILTELAEAEREAADPNTKWFSHDEIWSEIADRRSKKDV